MSQCSPLLRPDHHVLEDAQAGKEPHALEGPGDPELRQFVGVVVLDQGSPVIGDNSRVGAHEPADDVEQGGFPGTIGPDDAHDLSLRRRHGDVVEGHDPPESHAELVDAQCLSVTWQDGGGRARHELASSH